MTGLDEFLGVFFGVSNRVSLDSSGERLAPWIDRLRGERPQPTLLPRQTPEGEWILYALTFDVHQRADMDMRLQAFIGRSWSDFPFGRQLDPADPLEAAVGEFTRRCGFKLHILGGTDAQRHVRDALDLLRQCDESRPEGTRDRRRPLPQLIYEFDMSLSIRHELQAEEALLALRRSRRLSEENLRFLRIRLLGRFGRWHEIDGSLDTLDVARLPRRPHPVTEDLLEAALRVHVIPTPNVGHVEALEAWKLGVPPLVRALVAQAASRPTRASTHLCILLEAMVSSWGSAADIGSQAVASIGTDEPERPLLDALVAMVARPAPAPTLERVRQLLAAGEPEAAWLVARQLEWTPNLLPLQQMAVRAAGLHEAAAEINERQDSAKPLAEADRAAAPSPEPCVGWTTWLRRVSEPAIDAEEHLAHARRRADAWTHRGLGRENSDLTALAGAFGTAIGANRSLVLRALPHLLECLAADDRWASLEMRPLTCDLIEALLLSLEDGLGEVDLAALGELVAAAMRDGFEERRLQDWCALLAPSFRSKLPLSLMAAAIDLLEVTYLFASHRFELLAPLGLALAQLARQAPHRVDALTRTSLDELLRDLALDQVFSGEPRSEEESPLDWLRGKKLGLYSLNEPSLRRAKSQIENALGGAIDIRLEHAKVATAPLEAMARQCDVVVMVTGAAKHAATGCIEANLGQHTELVRVHAQGAARLLDALRR